MGDAMTDDDAPHERTVRDYLLQQVLDETRMNGARLDRIEEKANRAESTNDRVLEFMQRVFFTERRQTMQGRRLRMLERVVYESAPPPEMQGPPNRRRPVIPAPGVNDDEDTGRFEIPPEVAAQLKSLEEMRLREQRRDSWAYRKRREIAVGVVGALLTVLLGACGAELGPAIKRALFPTTSQNH